MAENINIGGRLHSTATGNVVVGANEILDDTINKKQSEINVETYRLVENINESLENLSPEQAEALSVAEKANNNEVKLGYFECETESNIAAKVITNATGYILSKGGSIKIKMINSNTASNVTLNINSTGAKNLYYNGGLASPTNTWENNEIIEVYYDGNDYYANNIESGGKFSTGEKVKEVGIDDEPTAGSDNLVKSGGVKAAIPEIINNLTVGGNTKALSAEQGKVIADTTMELIQSINLLNPSTIIVGKRMNFRGVVSDNDTYTEPYIYGITDFIEISQEGLILNHAYGGDAPSAGSVGSIVIFDENKTMVAYYYPAGYVTGNSYAVDPTGHSDWKYVRFTLAMANAGTENATSYYNIANDGYAIYKGLSLPTPQYQEYIEPYYEMKSNVDIIDNLESDRDDAALSAKQGKTLSEKIYENKTDIEYLTDSIFNDTDYLEENSVFPTTNGITSEAELRAFLLRFEMLVPRDTNYMYSLAVNNGKPTGTPRAYAVSVIRWPYNEEPTNSNTSIYANYVSATQPQNGELDIRIGGVGGSVAAKVLLNWTALQSSFGGDGFFEGLGKNVRFNQVVIFNEEQDTFESRIETLEQNEDKPYFPKFHLPKSIYCVKDDKNLLFTRGIVQAVNPYLWSLVYNGSDATAKNGAYPAPRYLQLLYSSDMTKTITLKLVGDDGTSSNQETSNIIVKTPQQPQSNINVLCFGSSTTVDGGWASELKRRLCGVDGTPAGDNLSNITFVGRTKGTTYSDVLVEGISGWSWNKYMNGSTILVQYGLIKFSVSGNPNFVIGDIYIYTNVNNETTSVRIEDYNGSDLVCSFRTSDNTNPIATGSLILSSGTGDASITYTAFENNYQWTPFRNNGVFGFQSYANKYCNGSIDVVICLLSYLNQVLPTGDISASIQSMKDFVNQLHTDFPNCKVLISAGVGASPYGGAGKNYCANETWTDYGILHGEFVFQDGLEEMIASSEYSNFCYMFNSLQEVDMENAFPTDTIPVNLRSNDTEVVQTNALHPNHSGELMTADSAYRCFVCTILN